MTKQSQVEELLTSLERAIKGDRRFYVATKIDPQFNHIREFISDLLTRLNDQAKSQAEKELRIAQSASDEMKAWQTYDNAASDALKKAQDNFMTGSYFGYLDTPAPAQEATNRARAATFAQKTSLEKNIAKLESKANSLESEIRHLIANWHPLKGQYPLDQNQEIEFESALSSIKEAQQYAKTETYDSYRKAKSFLQQCIDILQKLYIDLTRTKHIFEANSKYERRLAEATEEKNYKLSRLHLAFVFMFVPSTIASILFLIAIVKQDSSVVWLMLLGVLLFRPDSIVGWLMLLGIASSLLTIAAIVAYLKGLMTIPSVYQEKIFLTEQEHSKALQVDYSDPARLS